MANADGSIVIKARVDMVKAEKDLAKLKASIKKTEDDIKSLTAQKMPLVKELERLGLEADEAAKKLDMMKSALTGTFSGEKIKEQAETAKYLGLEFDSVQRKIASYDSKIQSATAKLDQQTEEAGELAQNINAADRNTRKYAAAQEKASKGASRFAARLRAVIRSALIFTVVTKALAALREWVNGLIVTNEDARASVGRLKGALLTMAQPLVNVVIPAFTKAVDVLTSAIIVIGRLFSAISGTTYEEAKEAAKVLNKEQQMIQGVGDAAKEATKQLASFDEINKLGSAEKSAAISPDFSGLDFSSLPGWLQSFTLDLEAKIEALRFNIDNGTLLQNSDDWAWALEKVLFVVVGAMFGGLKGAVLAIALSVVADIIGIKFADKFQDKENAKKLFDGAILAILGAIIGAKFGGLTGAIIGLLVGVTFSIGKATFEEGKTNWDKDSTLVVVLGSILGAIIGGIFGGISGSVIGLLLGASISFVSLKFLEGGKYSKADAISTLRTAIITMLGVVLGGVAVQFTGLSTAGVIGALFGLTIGFASVAFDKNMDPSVREKAKSNFITALMGLIGAIIGTAFLGPIGTVVGGAIGIGVGLFVNFVIEGWDFVDKNVPNFKGIGPDYSWMFGSSATVTTIPSIAAGTIVPSTSSFITSPSENLKATAEDVVKSLMQVGSLYGGEKQTVDITVKAAPGMARYLKYEIDSESSRQGESLVGGAVR